MTAAVFNRIALPAFAILAFALAAALPAWRLWRKTGSWGVVAHRPAHPLQRWTAGWIIALLTALAVWIVLYAWKGPQWLGVWNLGPGVTWAGWLGAVAGLALTLLGQVHLGRSWRIGIDDRPTGLVTRGIYRLVRNPIFGGMIVIMGGLTLASPSAWTVTGWLFAMAILGVQTRAEEQHLLALHGEQYRVYAARVGRFLPGVGRLR